LIPGPRSVQLPGLPEAVSFIVRIEPDIAALKTLVRVDATAQCKPGEAEKPVPLSPVLSNIETGEAPMYGEDRVAPSVSEDCIDELTGFTVKRRNLHLMAIGVAKKYRLSDARIVRAVKSGAKLL
jgi:hypothetical protein